MSEMRMQGPQEDALGGAMREAEAKMRCDHQRKQVDQRIDTLAKRVMAYRNNPRFGLEHPTTKMLTKFLEVALKMKEMVDNMQAVTMALSCITDTIQMLDDTLAFDQNMFSSLSGETKYGFFYNLKVKRQTQRAVANHQRRMRAFSSQIEAKIRMAEGMANAMSNLDFGFGKKKKKGAPDAPSSPEVEDYLSRMGGGSGAPAAPAAPASPGDSVTGGL